MLVSNVVLLPEEEEIEHIEILDLLDVVIAHRNLPRDLGREVDNIIIPE